MRELIVLYDGDCGFCSVVLATLLRWDRAKRLGPVTIQSARGGELLGDLALQDRLESWHLIDADGARYSGGAGLPVVFGALPRGRALAIAASRFPTATARGYGWVARHRAAFGRLIGARARAWAARVIDEHERADQNCETTGR